MSYAHDSKQATRRWIGPVERYDLIAEGLIAVGVVGVLVLVLAVLFGSPEINGVPFKSWANAAPEDFAYTTLTELTGVSEAATYGPPYNSGAVALKITQSLTQTANGLSIYPGGLSQAQNLGPLAPQAWIGVTYPIDAPEDFVLKPLEALAGADPAARQALDQWRNASVEERSTWANAALPATLKYSDGTIVIDTKEDVGPIPAILTSLTNAARSGLLTSELVDRGFGGYSTDNTRSLLYIADGNYLGDIANQYNLTGPEWGVMGEIGSWSGQPWLWWYTMFYNIPIWSSIGTDILALASAAVFMAIVFLIPFLPGARNLPRWLGVYRLIWRPYYRRYGSSRSPKVAPRQSPAD